MTSEENRIFELSGKVRTAPRFDWKISSKGDGKCYICERPSMPGNEYYCCDRCRKAALAWNKRYNPGSIK
jgi:hypothetical protein